MFIARSSSYKPKRHRRDILTSQSHATPDGVGIILFDRIYKHSTPTALGGGESLRAKQRQSEQEHLFHSLMQRAFRGELVGE